MKIPKHFAVFGWITLVSISLISVYAAPGQKDEYSFQEGIKIPMRDGVNLGANLFLPGGTGPFPCILMRSPYGIGNKDFGDGKYFAARGYAVVVQSTRGKTPSEGEWEPFRDDGKDGYDTQEWIGKQSWCNGRIGTFGGSYVGYTQWITAPQNSQYLKAIMAAVPLADPYHEVTYVGGAYQLALSMGWGTMVSYQLGEPVKNLDWTNALRHLPLFSWDDVVGKKIPYLRDWVAHPFYDEYWKSRGIDGKYENIQVPIINIGGWYDIFSKATLEQVRWVREKSKDRKVRRNQFVIMGPWAHGVGSPKVGEINFGSTAGLDQNDLKSKWFDYWLKDSNTGVEDWPAVRIFVMGTNVWRDEHEWPLKRTHYVPYYFHSQGRANTRTGNGLLKTTPPEGSQPEDKYIYNPENPVPTLGGNNLVFAAAGPYDQQKIEEREDVLVYTSDILSKPFEVTGPVKAVLYASTSAKDTDFTAKLVDVFPDGKAINLCEGIIRARYRFSDTQPSLVAPGMVFRYEVDLWVTSNVFMPGHRIRLEISSSNFPRFDRNPNTGNTFGSDDKMEKAEQTIYHGPEYLSHVLLPVITN